VLVVVGAAVVLVDVLVVVVVGAAVVLVDVLVVVVGAAVVLVVVDVVVVVAHGVLFITIPLLSICTEKAGGSNTPTSWMLYHSFCPTQSISGPVKLEANLVPIPIAPKEEAFVAYIENDGKFIQAADAVDSPLPSLLPVLNSVLGKVVVEVVVDVVVGAAVVLVVVVDVVVGTTVHVVASSVNTQENVPLCLDTLPDIAQKSGVPLSARTT